MRLLLASASPARRATLRAAGIDPFVVVSGVDEEALLDAAHREAGQPVPAPEQVLLLARAKAREVAARPAVHDERDVVVLGCDSMLELDGAVLGKPTDAADAAHRWRAMRGRSAALHTGHWLVRAGARPAGAAVARPTGPAAAWPGAPSGVVEVGATSTTTVHFAEVSDAEIEAYVATGEPLAVAGAFTVDGFGGPFVTGIEGDHHGVVGVSLPLLRELLAGIGVAVTELWTPRPPARPAEPDGGPATPASAASPA